MTRPTRAGKLVLGTALLLTTAGLALLAPSSASAVSSCSPPPGSDVIPVVGDVNQDGTGDVAAGVPNANINGQPVGALDVFLSDGGRQRISPATLGRQPVGGSRFGASTALVDLDHDSCADAVVGSPGESAVYLVLGSTNGLTSQGVVRLPSPGGAGDGFGTSVAATIRAVNGPTDVWIGAPLTTVSGQSEAGVVHHYTVSASGVPSLTSTVSFADVGGGVATGDRLGEKLAAIEDGVGVGVPRRDVAGRADAGALAVLHQQGGGLSTELFTQDSAGVAGAVEAGDAFGSAVSGSPYGHSLLVGIPGEDIGSLADAGSAQILLRDGATYRAGSEAHQGAGGIPGVARTGDRFGAGVAVGRATSCQEATGYAVGAPRDDLGSATDAGTVTVFSRGEDGTCPVKVFRQGASLTGTAESGDRLGTTLSNRRYRDDFDEDIYDTLLIGVPGEDGSSGLVQLPGGVPAALGPVRTSASSAFGTFLATDAVGPSF